VLRTLRDAFANTRALSLSLKADIYVAAPMQQSAIFFTLLAPLILHAACRHFSTPRFQNLVGRALALCLLAFGLLATADKIATGSDLGTMLPMHLCDWVLYAVAAALWFRWQLGFELGYFWGLAGTIQALITPAISMNEVWWRLFGFFFSHALIVVSVLHLLITERCRPWPRSLLRVFVCSEFYVVAALFANAATGGNYGFLAHRPPQATLLDRFSDTHWLYVVQINALALVFFPALYLPWWIWDSAVKARRGSAPIPPA
jgi:hypothetical integral membrane protein (TIGR02206 family)